MVWYIQPKGKSMESEDLVEVTYRNGEKEIGRRQDFRWTPIFAIEIFSKFSRAECGEYDIVKHKAIG